MFEALRTAPLARWLLVALLAADPLAAGADGADEAGEPAEEPGPPAAAGPPAPPFPAAERRASPVRRYLRDSPRYTHVGFGPLELSSQSPLQVLRLGIRPRTPTTLEEGRLEVRAGSTWVNIWSRGEAYTLDFEMLETSLSVAYGLADGMEVELELQNRSRFGGELDSVSRWFHDMFGIPQNGRDELPRDDFNFWLIPDDGRPPVVLDRDDKGSFSRSVLVTLQHSVSYGGNRRPAVSYALTGRFETADFDEVRGPRRMDVGGSVALARGFGRVYVYGTLGAARFARNDFRGLELRRTQVSLLTAFEWRFLQRQSLLFQYLVTEGLVDSFGPFSRPSNELTLGWKWEPRAGTLIELGLIENLLEFDNTPDFGFQFGVARRF